MTKLGSLANLIDSYNSDYSIQEWLDQFLPGFTFGEIIEILYACGEIPEDAIREFLED